MDELKTALLNILKEQEKAKSNKRIVPSHSLLIPLHQTVNDALNELYSEGKIDVGPTMNDKYIKLL